MKAAVLDGLAAAQIGLPRSRMTHKLAGVVASMCLVDVTTVNPESSKLDSPNQHRLNSKSISSHASRLYNPPNSLFHGTHDITTLSINRLLRQKAAK